MGLLGFHLTASAFATLFLQKIIIYFPVVNGLLSGLLLWTVPNNSYLSEFVQLALSSANSNGNGSGKSRPPRKVAAEKRSNHSHSHQQTAGAAKKDVDLPKELPLPLIPVKLTPKDVGVLLYFDDLFFVLNTAAVVGMVFVASEVFQALWPDKWQSDTNFTILWILLVLFSSLRALVMLTWAVVVKQSQDSERMLIGLASLCFFVLAIAVLILDGSWLDLKLDEGLSKFIDVDSAGRKLRRKNSSLLFLLKTSLCACAALFASSLLFPALRLARSYLGAMKRSGLLEKALFLVSFVSPVLLVLLWVPPLTTAVLFPEDGEPRIPGLTLSHYQHVRLLLVFLFCVLRVLMARPHLQQYLHSAHARVEAQRRTTARFTSSKFSDAVRTVNGGLAVVALQYLCPVIILMACVLLLHSLGNYSWTGEYLADVTPATPSPGDLRLMSRLPSLLASLFPTAFLTGVLSFWTVWLLICISVSTCLGFLYANAMEG